MAFPFHFIINAHHRRTPQDISPILDKLQQPYSLSSPEYRSACAAYRSADSGTKRRMRSGADGAQGSKTTQGPGTVLHAAWLHFCALRALLVLTDHLGLVSVFPFRLGTSVS